jgi:arylsulfatase A-like enzyme
MKLIIYRVLLPIILMLSIVTMSFSAQPADKLNIVLILVDDLGWTDLTCYGSDLHETPHVDRLAQRGMRFTQAYAPSPVCTPSRAALMCGEHPARLHMTVWREAAKNPPNDKKLIPPITEEDLSLQKLTIAERLKEAGYMTAHIGKWHLGDAGHYPQTQGFDFAVGGTHWGCPKTFFYPYRGMMHGDFRYIPGLGIGNPDDYLTDRLTDQALEVIDSWADRPFFLYMAYYTVHTPIEAKPAMVDHYQKKLKPGMLHNNATYAAMVKSMDDNVGRILQKLEDQGIEKRTVVIFTSDNGGFINKWRSFPNITNNAPLRSGKGSLYEGGVRVPLIVYWPGLTKPGTSSQEPVVLTDLYTTLLAAMGLDPTPGASRFDGMNLIPLFENADAKLSRKSLYWHYPHYYRTTTPVSSIRAGQWKLLEYLEDGRLELYNLSEDPGEQNNLAATKVNKAEELQQQLHAWREEVKAQMPTVK